MRPKMKNPADFYCHRGKKQPFLMRIEKKAFTDCEDFLAKSTVKSNVSFGGMSIAQDVPAHRLSGAAS